MDAAVERVTAAKHSAGFIVDDLAAACTMTADNERLRIALKLAAELFNTLSGLEVEIQRSVEISSAQTPSQKDGRPEAT